MRLKSKNIAVIVEQDKIPFQVDPNNKDAKEKLDLANKVGLGDIQHGRINPDNNNTPDKVENGRVGAKARDSRRLDGTK